MDRSASVRRRLRTIPLVVLAWLVTVALLPVLLAAAVVVDAVRWSVRRTPWMAARIVTFVTAYLFAEVVGLVALFGVWVLAACGRNRPRLERSTFSVQRAWSGFVFWAVRTVFSLRFDVEGLEAVQPEPYLIFSRHASIVDNLLPSQFITRPFGTHIRYVMKRELLGDPALDVAGSRLPNAFIRRGSGEGDREIASIKALAASLGPGEAVLIYPEGTRFTPEKLETARRRLERSSPRLAGIAGGLRHVLPPRLGGPLALLESCAADVVVLAHRGLDGFARVADIWRGGMVRTRVTVRFHRVPRSEIPDDRADRAEWLFGVWQDIDDWVGRPAPVRA
jgi:1-acyl-sn-glycerol-3-phosphate acyltransferase